MQATSMITLRTQLEGLKTYAVDVDSEQGMK